MNISYAEAVNQALHQSMIHDHQVVVIGEGVPDPKSIFGTTSGLIDNFGPDRVFDMPLSENGLTGICIGAALSGIKPVMVHQRIDFSLLAMDQIVNNAAKWRYMFAGKSSVPITIRLIIGRGWGQGPQHSQNLHALFAAIPGLKVVMPTTAYDAKGMLCAAIQDPDPVLLIEHRWLHHLKGYVPNEYYKVNLDKAKIHSFGSDITLVCFSYMLVEAIKAAKLLDDFGIKCELVDMRSISPLDTDLVISSVKKTKKLLVLDTAQNQGSIGHELISKVVIETFCYLETAPKLIACPDHPLPTSRFLADSYYPDAADIALSVLDLFNQNIVSEEIISVLRRPEPRDQPNPEFTGPF